MDWTRSYSTSWRIFRVNRRTWADAEQIVKADGVSITRTADGDLLESGNMKVTGDFEPDYYRIVMTAEQDNDVERVDIATLLFDVTGGEANRGTLEQEADGFSVLYPASKTLITAGDYAPAGVDGAYYVGKLLQNTINAPVEVEGSFTLNEHIVHEIGNSVLEAAWSVLNAGGFIMQIDGRGIVHIKPKPVEPDLIIDNAVNVRLLSNGIKYTTDMSEIPNRYIVIIGNNKTVAVNDYDNPVSYSSRGYYVDLIDDSPKPVNGETISAYADRKLREASVMLDSRAYTREYYPDVYLYSIVRGSIDGLEGDMRVTEQTITCGHGALYEETAEMEVSVL